jgi:hypothetical protein
VGKLQASTFKILASFSGYGEVPAPKTVSAKKPPAEVKKITKKPETAISGTDKVSSVQAAKPTTESRSFGLTVRIEINLPADGDQKTYDRIFKSIRENLLNE